MTRTGSNVASLCVQDKILSFKRVAGGGVRCEFRDPCGYTVIIIGCWTCSFEPREFHLPICPDHLVYLGNLYSLSNAFSFFDF